MLPHERMIRRAFRDGWGDYAWDLPFDSGGWMPAIEREARRAGWLAHKRIHQAGQETLQGTEQEVRRVGRPSRCTAVEAYLEQLTTGAV